MPIVKRGSRVEEYFPTSDAIAKYFSIKPLLDEAIALIRKMEEVYIKLQSSSARLTILKLVEVSGHMPNPTALVASYLQDHFDKWGVQVTRYNISSIRERVWIEKNVLKKEYQENQGRVLSIYQEEPDFFTEEAAAFIDNQRIHRYRIGLGKKTFGDWLAILHLDDPSLEEFLAAIEFTKAQAQNYPIKLEDGTFLFKDYIYDVKGDFTDEEFSLLILEHFDRDRLRFEKMRQKYLSPIQQAELNRPRIPENVRIEVWRRDDGKCARCGSREKLEYDHIVPISKGGSNTARNIELLCEKCNRIKGANIA